MERIPKSTCSYSKNRYILYKVVLCRGSLDAQIEKPVQEVYTLTSEKI